MASAASPSSNSSSTSRSQGIHHDPSTKHEIDLARKRARDRKSQQAMRDRAKCNVQTLTEQINILSRALDEHAGHAAELEQRLHSLEGENEHLRVQNAALRLSLLGDGNALEGPTSIPQWQIPPNNIQASNISDSIVQGVVYAKRKAASVSSEAPSPADSITYMPVYPPKPNFCVLLDKETRAEDDISNVVGDIVKSYTEIESLPNQVAAAYVMITLMKWQSLLDESSWRQMPDWLRPTHTQLTIPHAAWIDRMPWPPIRDWLVAHPEVTLDDVAAVYSSSFSILWDYDPAHVLIPVDDVTKVVITNPIFEEHIRQLKNWDLGDKFRSRFPELAMLVHEELG